MKELHPEILEAIEIAARFGFISQEIFFKFVTSRRRTMAYFIWRELLKTRYFERYNQSTIPNSYLKLSPYGKSENDIRGKFISMPTPSPQQLSHDEILLRFALQNEKKGFFEYALTESCSKYNGLFAQHFVARNLKYPDLQFGLGSGSREFKVALELERTRKSNLRYQMNLLSYSVHKQVDLVIYVTSHETIERSIKNAALKIKYPSDKKPLAFVKMKDFISSPTTFPIQLGDRDMKFDELVQRLKQEKSVAA